MIKTVLVTCFSLFHCKVAPRDDDVDFALDQFGRDFGKPSDWPSADRRSRTKFEGF